MSRRTLHPALRRLRWRVCHVRHDGAFRRLLTVCSRRMSSFQFEAIRPKLNLYRMDALLWRKDKKLHFSFALGAPRVKGGCR